MCGLPSARQASCNAIVDQNVSGNITPAAVPFGFGPADLQAAYQLPASSAGAGQTVAIVDAFDLPTAEADLATYRAQYGLPACTTANGCFRKVNQSGGSTPPGPDPGWGQEIALDLDMVSAACPNCSILLVEANSAGMSSLGAAENTAVQLGATAVSNSWGGSESSTESQADAAYFDHPGVAITASAGDSGYGVEYPAASPDVIAVGGTTLSVSAGTRGYSETAWSGTGSGCSLYEPKPSWQKDSGCTNRSVVDIAADADPSTGVAVYDSTLSGGLIGWQVFGGTSAAAPLVAGAYELASHGTPPPVIAAQTLYGNPSSFFDVTSGSNGSCSPAYLCTAQPGYDGPTGLGTPAGVAGFGPSGASPASRPGAPAIQSAVAGDRKVTLTWQAPANSGGSPITGYVVTPSIGGVPQPAHLFSSTALTEAFTGLANGTNYTFAVSAVNASGSGAASNPSPPVMPFDALTTKYLALGGAASYLGAPAGAEAFLANGGRSQAYVGGAIYWSAATGAHAVRGAILTRYKALGAASSVLGFPTTDSLTAADRVGVYNHFAKGSIYWYPTLGAHVVRSPIDTKYISLGALTSRLRYPIGDTFVVPGGWRDNFQHGYLVYVSTTKAVLVYYTA